MTKFRKSLLIFGILVLIIGAALGTFIVLSLTGSLKVEPIALEFTVDDAQKEYDGNALKATSYSITDGYLVEGHTPVISFTGEQTDAGNGISGLDVKIVDEKGYDVTDEYKIKVNGGALLVMPCGLQIKLTTQDVIYDGTAIDIGNGYTVTGGSLAKGHRVSAQIKDEWFETAGKTVAGKTLDVTDVDIMIVDGNGRNVTGNYSVILAGRVNIIQRPLVVTPVSAEKTYDGKPLECTQYKIESGSLASGHYIVPKFEAYDGMAAKVTDANSQRPLEVRVRVAIYDLNDDDVTDNYKLGYNAGYLTVNKASLTVTAKSGSWAYDGKTHSLSEETLPDSVAGLVYGDEVTVIYSGSVKDVSTEENKIDKCFINGEENNGNYDITLKSGKLKVTKAPLTVTLKALEKEYDGKPFTADENIYAISSTLDNLQLKFNDGSYLEKLFDGITEIGNSTYTLSDFNEFEIYSGSEKVTDKFNISVIPGNLKITRKNVSFSADNLTKTYDGNFNFTEGGRIEGLLSGHKLDYIACAPISAVGLNNAVITSISIVDAQGANASGYYNVDYDPSVRVTINPRDLEVSSQTREKEYDGTPLNGGDLSYGMLASGDRLIVTAQFEITNCSESEENNNVPEFEIRNVNNELVTQFYNINPVYGTLTVNKKEITVYILPCELEYERGGISGVKLSGRIMCDGASTEYFAVSNSTFNGLGKFNVEFDWTADALLKENYDIKKGNTEFTVVQRKLTADINGSYASKNYDTAPVEYANLGSNLIGEGIYNSYKEEVEINRADFVCVSSNLLGKVNAGIYDAEIVYETNDKNERLTVTGKYVINAIHVEVVANKALVTTYNGKPFEPSVSDLTVKSSLGDDVFSVKSYVRSNDVIDAGARIQSFSSFEFILAGTGESVNQNVQFEKTSVGVTVNKRELIIALGTINLKESDIPTVGNMNLTGIISVSNLADGDNIDYGDGYGIIWVDGQMSFLSIDAVTVMRNGKDVTKNYTMPDEVTGAVILI